MISCALICYHSYLKVDFNYSGYDRVAGRKSTACQELFLPHFPFLCLHSVAKQDSTTIIPSPGIDRDGWLLYTMSSSFCRPTNASISGEMAERARKALEEEFKKTEPDSTANPESTALPVILIRNIPREAQDAMDEFKKVFCGGYRWGGLLKLTWELEVRFVLIEAPAMDHRCPFSRKSAPRSTANDKGLPWTFGTKRKL